MRDDASFAESVIMLACSGFWISKNVIAYVPSVSLSCKIEEGGGT